jgi:site-specific DNA recombinase
VVDQVRDLGKDPQVVLATLREAQRQTQVKKPALKAEMAALKADVSRQRQEMERLVKLVARGDRVAEAAAGPIGDLQEAIEKQEARLREIQEELKALRRSTVDEADLRKVLSLFDPIWDALFPAERQRILHLLIERVDYDAGAGSAKLTFRPTGIRTLAAECEEYHEG